MKIHENCPILLLKNAMVFLLYVVQLAVLIIYHTRTSHPVLGGCSCAVTSGKHVRAMNTPRKPHFYIVKLGYAGVYLFFLFLLQNIDCGYSLLVPTIYVLSKNKKNIKLFQLKISIFKAQKFSVYCMGKFS